MIGSYTLEKLTELSKKEREFADKEHGKFFNTTHEGWAVLKEEVEEASHELAACERLTDEMWSNVKRDQNFKTGLCVAEIKRRALYLAAEALQVVAMTDKLNDSFLWERE